MRQLSRLVITACMVTTPLNAQARDLAVSALSLEWRQISANLLKAAMATPDSIYAFRPVQTVWSFGELVHHVAESQIVNCASVAGRATTAEAAPASDAPKAELVAYLQRSLAACGPAYQQNLVATSLATAEVMKRYGALVHNTAHINEHYGNVVTYLRIKGLVPPSSQR